MDSTIPASTPNFGTKPQFTIDDPKFSLSQFPGKQKSVINFGPGPAKLPESVSLGFFCVVFNT